MFFFNFRAVWLLRCIPAEYEGQYTAIENSPAIPTFTSTSAMRWSVLLDALFIGTTSAMLSSTVANVPPNKAVVMLDSGTSVRYVMPCSSHTIADTKIHSYLPTTISDQIYGSAPGASYSSELGQWVIPCDVEIDIAVQFGYALSFAILVILVNVNGCISGRRCLQSTHRMLLLRTLPTLASARGHS